MSEYVEALDAQTGEKLTVRKGLSREELDFIERAKASGAKSWEEIIQLQNWGALDE
jgi:hypothetical protein